MQFKHALEGGWGSSSSLIAWIHTRMLVGINFGVSSINMGLIELLKYIILRAYPLKKS